MMEVAQYHQETNHQDAAEEQDMEVGFVSCFLDEK